MRRECWRGWQRMRVAARRLGGSKNCNVSVLVVEPTLSVSAPTRCGPDLPPTPKQTSRCNSKPVGWTLAHASAPPHACPTPQPSKLRLPPFSAHWPRLRHPARSLPLPRQQARTPRRVHFHLRRHLAGEQCAFTCDGTWQGTGALALAACKQSAR